MTKAEIAAVFRPLVDGHFDEFFERVDENVEWSVLGTHPLGGVYYSKEEFRGATFARLGKLFDHGLAMRVRGVLVDGDSAAVELHANEVSHGGVRFEHDTCWVCRFRDGKIVEVRSYPDSALIQKVINAGELRWPARATRKHTTIRHRV